MKPNREGIWEWNSKTLGTVIVDVYYQKTYGLSVLMTNLSFLKIDHLPDKWGKRLSDLDRNELHEFDYD